MTEHISMNDEVQRHSQAPSAPTHTHTHNGRPCTGHHHGPNNQNNRPTNHSQYFRMFKQSFYSNRVFFWNQLLSGGVLDQISRRYSALSFLKTLRSNYLQKFLSTVLGFATQFLPNILKPFFAGFFIPLLIFMYVNWKLLSLRIFSQLEQQSYIPTLVQWLYYTVLILFVLVALSGPGSLCNQENKQKTNKILAQKSYMNNPRAVCKVCEVFKGFRSQHCPNCKQCIPKYSQHSPVFNRCIGASNQLFYMLFNLSIFLAQGVVLYLFSFRSPQDMYLSTKIIVLLLNNYIQWLSLVQFLTMLILNFWYNMTQHQARNWMMAPYLIAFGKRQFFNPLNIGICNNIKQSIYAIFGIQGSEEENNVIIGSIIQPEQNTKPYITNWAKVMYTSGSELRNHPYRRQIAMKTKQIQIMNRIRQQVLNEQKGKRPIHEINQIIMMQTQMELQKQMQRIMMAQRMQQQSQNPISQPKNNRQTKQSKQEVESKGDQDERLIQQKEQSATDIALIESSDLIGN